MIYKIRLFFRIWFERLERMISFAKLGYDNYDFDYAHVYDILLFKLKRLEKVLKNGDTEQNDKSMRALSLAIKLCKRLQEEDYSFHYQNAIKKWEAVMVERSSSNKNFTTLELVPNRAKTKKEKEDFEKQVRSSIQMDERRHQRDTDIFYKILAKYSRTWWD